MSLKRKSYILVVAITIGRTFSTYAFQFRNDFHINPLNIWVPQAWDDGEKTLISCKAPTCLLLDKDREIHSFGFEAENKYVELCTENANHQWFFFNRFKLQLEECLKKDSQLVDETGKKMPALQVFSLFIQCLMNHLTKILNNQRKDVKNEEIYWVFTVSSNWNDCAKRFMRKAAEQAGILSDNIDIVSEPDAAFLYFQYLRVDEFCIHRGCFSVSRRYMVLYLEGSSTDVTVHEMISGGKLKKINMVSSGPWGGDSVDAAFFKLMVDLVGNPVMMAFQNEKRNDYLDFYRDFELVKRHLTATTTDRVIIKLPASLQNLCREKNGCTFRECVHKSYYSNQIEVIFDKIRMDPELVRDLFRQVTKKIVDHVKKSLKMTPRVSMIFMVGAFSESGFVQDIIRIKFQDKMGLKVTPPLKDDLSVVNGAALFGWKTLDPRYLCSCRNDN